VRLRAICITNHPPSCFDTAGWVIRPVKNAVLDITHIVSSGTLNLTQSISHSVCNLFRDVIF